MLDDPAKNLQPTSAVWPATNGEAEDFSDWRRFALELAEANLDLWQALEEQSRLLADLRSELEEQKSLSGDGSKDVQNKTRENRRFERLVSGLSGQRQEPSAQH